MDKVVIGHFAGFEKYLQEFVSSYFENEYKHFDCSLYYDPWVELEFFLKQNKGGYVFIEEISILPFDPKTETLPGMNTNVKIKKAFELIEKYGCKYVVSLHMYNSGGNDNIIGGSDVLYRSDFIIKISSDYEMQIIKNRYGDKGNKGDVRNYLLSTRREKSIDSILE